MKYILQFHPTNKLEKLNPAKLSTQLVNYCFPVHLVLNAASFFLLGQINVHYTAAVSVIYFQLMSRYRGWRTLPTTSHDHGNLQGGPVPRRLSFASLPFGSSTTLPMCSANSVRFAVAQENRADMRTCAAFQNCITKPRSMTYWPTLYNPKRNCLLGLLLNFTDRSISPGNEPLFYLKRPSFFEIYWSHFFSRSGFTAWNLSFGKYINNFPLPMLLKRNQVGITNLSGKLPHSMGSTILFTLNCIYYGCQ